MKEIDRQPELPLRKYGNSKSDLEPFVEVSFVMYSHFHKPLGDSFVTSSVRGPKLVSSPSILKPVQRQTFGTHSDLTH